MTVDTRFTIEMTNIGLGRQGGRYPALPYLPPRLQRLPRLVGLSRALQSGRG